jgi:hypothetical protein
MNNFFFQYPPKFFLTFFLGQIFVNLLSNSIKFSSKGEIVLRSKCLSLFDTIATVQFSVHDQGEGIPDDVQKKIFQPFFQADSSTSRRFGGSGKKFPGIFSQKGLGLNIAKRLTELMSGTIWFNSKIGQGTVFYFTVKLPIPGKFSEISLPSPVVQGKPDISINILVAEDNHINQVRPWALPLNKHLACYPTYVGWFGI